MSGKVSDSCLVVLVPQSQCDRKLWAAGQQLCWEGKGDLKLSFLIQNKTLSFVVGPSEQRDSLLYS